jgi:hypothetical protein
VEWTLDRPLLFNLYTNPIAHTIDAQAFPFHLYAEDTQIYITFASEKLMNHQFTSFPS